MIYAFFFASKIGLNQNKAFQAYKSDKTEKMRCKIHLSFLLENVPLVSFGIWN